MTTEDKIQEKRPAMFLWLVCYFSIAIFPLTVLLSFLFTKFGMPQDSITFLLAFCVSIAINKWYEALSEEVSEYLRKKYG